MKSTQLYAILASMSLVILYTMLTLVITNEECAVAVARKNVARDRTETALANISMTPRMGACGFVEDLKGGGSNKILIVGRRDFDETKDELVLAWTELNQARDTVNVAKIRCFATIIAASICLMPVLLYRLIVPPHLLS